MNGVEVRSSVLKLMFAAIGVINLVEYLYHGMKNWLTFHRRFEQIVASRVTQL
jgi:hypothetical protein